jgi:hypothetical protein
MQNGTMGHTRINGPRVVAGGLVAGLVGIAFEILAEPLFGLDWAVWLAGYGLPAPGGAVMAYFLVGGSLIGILAVWLYAAMRPRFGAGPGTAVRAGLVVWALACLFPTAGLAAYGLLPMDAHFWVPAFFPVVQWPLATLAGAWVYREGVIPPAGSRDAVGHPGASLPAAR